MYDTIYCIEYSCLVLKTVCFARSKYCPSGDNTSSDEQIIAENQAKDVQDEQELPGQCTHHNEIINSVGEATDGNDDPSKDPDHTIDAENTIIDEFDRTLDSIDSWRSK